MTAIPPLRRSATAFLLDYVARRKAGHALVFGTVLAAILCAVSTQYGLKHLIDRLAAGPVGSLDGIWPAFLFLCALILADSLLWRLAGWAAARSFTAVGGDIRRDLFGHLAGQDPGYFADRLPGALAARVSATAQAAFTVENTLAWNVVPPLGAILIAIGFTATVHPPLALALGLLAGLIAALMYRLARRGMPLHRRLASRSAMVDGELVDVVGNIGTVRAFGALGREKARLTGFIGAEIAAHRASLYNMERLRLVHALLTALLTAAVLAAALALWQQGRASIGDVALLATLSLTILNGTRDIAVAAVDLTQQMARLAEATETLLIPHALAERPDAVPLRRPALPDALPGAIPGAVAFEAVRFAYPGRPAVLDGLSLAIPAGQRVGLVGYSGAGKSTLLALLQRFHDPAAGRVMIDGQDLRGVTLDSLHAALAVVPQDTALFHRSVLENIRYGRPGADEVAVRQAAEAAQCLGFIEALPQGFDTLVGNRGVRLSGGQRQRLAIARALLKDAPILLLDEATSALDSESERAVQAALDRLMRGRTVIAVAHRLSTLQNFDRIIVMNAGRIEQDGAPQELAGRPGPYQELLRRQQAGLLPELPAV